MAKLEDGLPRRSAGSPVVERQSRASLLAMTSGVAIAHCLNDVPFS
ncbi:MAG: hypothetical protein R3Y11_12275 [Pseudomonadota bacterium]